MTGSDFKEMLINISANVWCSGSNCDDCKKHFGRDECPSTTNKFTHQERIEFWNEIHEELMRKIDEEDDLPFPREDWGPEDVLKILKEALEDKYG